MNYESDHQPLFYCPRLDALVVVDIDCLKEPIFIGVGPKKLLKILDDGTHQDYLVHEKGFEFIGACRWPKERAEICF